jgi:hypothetical protein
MASVLAIDPGNEASAYVLFEDGKPDDFGKLPNSEILDMLPDWRDCVYSPISGATVAIEMIASYGMPVGREVFETCVWIGRFIEAWSALHTLVYRKDVKLHLCGQARAKDGNVRQALIDRYGGKDKAIGTKKAPGPLKGVSADVWQALAVAVTWSDLQTQNARTCNPVASGEVCQ